MELDQLHKAPDMAKLAVKAIKNLQHSFSGLQAVTERAAVAMTNTAKELNRMQEGQPKIFWFKRIKQKP